MWSHPMSALFRLPSSGLWMGKYQKDDGDAGHDDDETSGCSKMVERVGDSFAGGIGNGVEFAGGPSCGKREDGGRGEGVGPVTSAGVTSDRKLVFEVFVVDLKRHVDLLHGVGDLGVVGVLVCVMLIVGVISLLGDACGAESGRLTRCACTGIARVGWGGESGMEGVVRVGLRVVPRVVARRRGGGLLRAAR
eukprot:scaffold13938_cov109-Isochrysis_galbana.AAC.7